MPAPIDHLTAARAAADAGDHATAATHASAQIAAAPAADAYTLLGVAQVMAGDEPAAEASFTRALYLDPAHFDALLHMMALLDRRGDRPAADNYRRRAAKAGAPR